MEPDAVALITADWETVGRPELSADPQNNCCSSVETVHYRPVSHTPTPEQKHPRSESSSPRLFSLENLAEAIWPFILFLSLKQPVAALPPLPLPIA